MYMHMHMHVQQVQVQQCMCISMSCPCPCPIVTRRETHVCLFYFTHALVSRMPSANPSQTSPRLCYHSVATLDPTWPSW